MLAHLSGDETLIEAFKRGEDIHDQHGAQGVRRRQRPRSARAAASREDHQLRAALREDGLHAAKDIGVTQQAAQEFIDAYFAGFPRVRGFIDRTLEEARRTAVVKTMFGRRRLVPEIASRNGAVRAAAERMTVNMPIQGTAADILKLAMIAIHEGLIERTPPGKRPQCRMILTVHDELSSRSKRDAAEEYKAFVRERMMHAASLAVPLDVDVGAGGQLAGCES